MEAGIKQYATFHVGEFLLGVDVLQVQEVLRLETLTPVPRASAVIAGLMNLRGEIVTALDMRQRLGIAPRAPDETFLHLIVRAEDGPVSLLVDEIGDIVQAREEDHHLPPPHVPAEVREVVRAICQLENQLLLVLDRDHAWRVSADQ